MAHISELALFDYLAGKSDLTTEEVTHLQECGDCNEQAIQFREAINTYGNISKARCFLFEEGEPPLVESPENTHEHPPERA
jgi:hypothetical protein